MERTKENLEIAEQLKIIFDKNIKIANSQGKEGKEAEEYALTVCDQCLMQFRMVLRQSAANAAAAGKTVEETDKYAHSQAIEVLKEIAETGGYYRTESEQYLYDLCP